MEKHQKLESSNNEECHLRFRPNNEYSVDELVALQLLEMMVNKYEENKEKNYGNNITE